MFIEKLQKVKLEPSDRLAESWHYLLQLSQKFFPPQTLATVPTQKVQGVQAVKLRMPHAVAMALVGGTLLPVISHHDPLAMKLVVYSHQTENTPFHQIHRCFPAALKKLRSRPFAVLISGANRLIQKLQQS